MERKKKVSRAMWRIFIAGFCTVGSFCSAPVLSVCPCPHELWHLSPDLLPRAAFCVIVRCKHFIYRISLNSTVKSASADYPLFRDEKHRGFCGNVPLKMLRVSNDSAVLRTRHRDDRLLNFNLLLQSNQIQSSSSLFISTIFIFNHCLN